MRVSPPSCTDDGEELGRLRLDEALSLMLSAVRPIGGIEWLELTAAVDRILAYDIVAECDVPPYANAAVDGFAVRAADLPPPGAEKELTLQGTVLAGHPTPVVLQAGGALRIMTGAPLPLGADTVLMQEHVDMLPGRIRVDGRHRAGDNVRQAGEDLSVGETVLSAGRRLTPADIGLIASLGQNEVAVHRRLRVALLSTGDELRNLGESRSPGCIYDSNRHSLRAALQRFGAEVMDLGIVRDHPQDLRAALLHAAHADVVISSGGVSVGEADHVKGVLAEIGDITFWKVAIKPGRPLAFGHIGATLFLGLPGNPVAVLVTYYHLALPVLQKLAGLHAPEPPLTLQARCTTHLRKRPGRTEFQRAILTRDATGGFSVRTTGRQGSGILRSMSLANAFIILPHDGGPVEPGDMVTVMPFPGLL